MGAGCSARATSSRSTSPTAGWRRPSSSVPTSWSTTGREDAERDGRGAHRRPRRRRRRSKRSAYRRRSNSRLSWSARVGTSPTSACTASRRRSTSRSSGSATSPSRPGSSTRTHADAAAAADGRPARRRRGSSPTTSPSTSSRRRTTCSAGRGDRRPEGRAHPGLIGQLRDALPEAAGHDHRRGERCCDRERDRLERRDERGPKPGDRGYS